MQVGTVISLPTVDKRVRLKVLNLGNLADDKAPMWRKYVVVQSATQKLAFKLDITYFNAVGFKVVQPAAVPLKGPQRAPGQTLLVQGPTGALTLANLTPHKMQPV